MAKQIDYVNWEIIMNSSLLETTRGFLVNFSDIAPIFITAVSVVFGLFGIIGAFRSGALRRVAIGPLELEGSERSKFEQGVRSALQSREATPFEIEQLANYYSQVLSQSKISFWFSLIFASFGFAVIVAAAFLYTTASSGATIAQFVAGLIMDAVAGLFFVQSRSAQKSMAEFFDKLRTDRMQAESRSLASQIKNETVRDKLHVVLALHYGGLSQPSQNIASLFALDSPVE